MTFRTLLPCDVKEFYPTALPDVFIDNLIRTVNAADECLSDLTQEQVSTLKLFSIAHLLIMAEGGPVRSESDMDGESISYDTSQRGQGFGETSYGRTAQSMPGYECIARLFDKPKRFFGAVG